ncbi:DUF1772 domain-containing protein [Rhodospirillaceae bacterium KN72]|uniref:DUF1772 domain-containing protein n=1 Tax=Pacificispira spongiicola TaxID=2729598 RepID=A0A7Y0DYU2_9PROT|nr:anthrone oxygenase family protein [Pacificispira spongiicola]NMM44111.1 DUF1772 domain-containing protein [Pacificispira spongiicola]
MSIDWTVYALLAAGLASALVAGVFQSFSDFIMRSLSAARPISGIDAMQMINRKVYRSLFLVLLLGLVPALPVLAWAISADLSTAAMTWTIAGSTVYGVFVFLITLAGNVPMNKRLDRLPTDSAEAAAYWTVYRRVWTRWNHVRTVGSAITAVCLTVAATIQAAA